MSPPGASEARGQYYLRRSVLSHLRIKAVQRQSLEPSVSTQRLQEIPGGGWGQAGSRPAALGALEGTQRPLAGEAL